MVSGPGEILSLLDLFHTELKTHSRALEEGLAGVEAPAARDRVESLARAAHSLRGGARIVGLDHAARLAQAMEELLTAAQNGTRLLSTTDLDHLRAANDFFCRLAACPPSEIPGNLEARSSDIEELAKRLLSPSEVAKLDSPTETAASPAVPIAVDPFLLDLFRTELEIHSRVLEEGLVATEARQDPAKIQELMRAAHSLKGAARIVGLDSAVRLAHAMEDMLSAAQRGERQLTGADFDLLLRGTDVLQWSGGARAGWHSGGAGRSVWKN